MALQRENNTNMSIAASTCTANTGKTHLGLMVLYVIFFICAAIETIARGSKISMSRARPYESLRVNLP